MVSCTGHDGSEPVISSMFLGSTAEVPEGSATPHMSEENNGSSELVAAGQSKALRLRLLPSIIPGHAAIFVSEMHYGAILRRRSQRASAKVGINRPNVKNRRQRRSTGGLTLAKGNQGKTNEGFSGTSSIPAEDFLPAEDFYGPFVATNEDEEHIGEDAFASILNLNSPDCTTLFRIMMGDKYDTDVSEEFKRVACLDSPNFSTLLTVMNNLSYDEAANDGYYCVDKVKLRLSGWL